MGNKSTIRNATGRICDEFRNLNIGESVAFPVPGYNYNSIRQTPHTTLIAETMNGRKWRTQVDMENKCIIVTRTQ